MEGVIIRAPVVDLGGSSSSVGASFAGGGKKSSAEFLKQLYISKPVVAVAKPIVSIPKAVAKTTTTTISSPVVEIAKPLMVGGAGLKEIPYAGTGFYEVSNVGVFPGLQDRSIQRGDVTLVERGEQALDISPNVFEAFKTPQLTSIKPIEQIKFSQVVIPVTKQQPSQQTKQLQRQLQLQLQLQRRLQRQRQTPKKIKTPSPFSLSFDGGGAPKIGKKTSKILEGFKVYVAKGGKDIKLGERSTLKGAKKLLGKELLTTLRAGGYIQRKGKKVKINLGSGFRPSKIDPLRIVQKKVKRFGTRTEAILGVKSRKGGRRKKRASKKKK